jgi:hypothetical protein
MRIEPRFPLVIRRFDDKSAPPKWRADKKTGPGRTMASSFPAQAARKPVITPCASGRNA